MKKRLLFGFVALIIAAIVAFAMNVNSNDYGLSDISLANIEALATSENGSDCQGCLQWDPDRDEIEGVKCKSTGCTEEYKGLCDKWCGK